MPQTAVRKNQSLTIAIALLVSACGDNGSDTGIHQTGAATKDTSAVASDSAVLTPATINGSGGKPTLIAASAISVLPGSTNNTYDFVISGPQRASGGHQSWTNVAWARVSYRGGLGLYRVTIDTSGWSNAETFRTFQLIANNDAGQTILTVRAIATAAASPAPTPPPSPVAVPAPVTPTLPIPAPAPVASAPATVSGTNGKPTLTAAPQLSVLADNSNNLTGFSISGTPRSSGGYQSWTNQSWAQVSYAGAHGQYQLQIDTSGWNSAETSRSLVLVANNDAGQTTMPITARIQSGVSTPPVVVATPADPITPAPVKQDDPIVATPASAANSVETIINDMGLPNDGILDGIPGFFWATNQVPGQVAMGADPRGCYAPQWWQNSGSVRAEYKDCEYWNGFIQWFVIFEGVGNAANNVRIETRRPRTWYLSKNTGQWKLLGQADGTGWFLASKSNLVYASDSVDTITGQDGSTSLRVDRASPYSYHGVWPQGVINIAGAVGDIRALFTTVEARLVVNDPSQNDDRDKAFWMLQSGADYYPDVGVPVQDALPPGAGLSRSKRLTSQWQSFNFATISNARVDYRGPNPPLTPAQLRQNPPPIN